MPCLMLVTAVLLSSTPRGYNPFEQTFGVSNVNAVAGHGGLTAAVSRQGDLAVLSWPGPSASDQLGYIGSNAPDARDQPQSGALPGMGAFLGLKVTTPQGTTQTWLRDASWSATQGYSREDAPVPVTQFLNSALGLKVTVTDIVSPSEDVLTRRVEVQRLPGSGVTGLSLLAYENLSPTQSRIPELPFADWALDPHNDFFAVWDAASGAILHFHPADRGSFTTLAAFLNRADFDYGPVELLMRQTTPAPDAVQAFVSSIDQAYGPGVAALVTTVPAPQAFQVGVDATPFCGFINGMMDNLAAIPERFPGQVSPISDSQAALLRCTDQTAERAARHQWKWNPRDALEDLSDGALEGSTIATGQTNGALVSALVFEGDRAEGAVVFAFGHTRTEASAALRQVQAKPLNQRQVESEQAAAQAFEGVALPDPALGEAVRTVALRALVNIYVARERSSGAVVASVCRQPSYFLDWPRDGAFITLALDVAGKHDWVTQRQRWYATLQRTEPTTGDPFLTPNVPYDHDAEKQQFPADAWEMNYYADGVMGGPIRFEIDNTALHVWSVAEHLAFLPEPERRALADELWPSTRRALALLIRWRDPKSALTARANEDDRFELTSTLHGAVTVNAALLAGIRVAHYLGDAEMVSQATARQQELKQAAFTAFWDEEAGVLRRPKVLPGSPEGEATAWASWPGRLFDEGDARMEHQMQFDLDTRVFPFLKGDMPRTAYVLKNVVPPLLLGRSGDGGSRDRAREAVIAMAQVASPDTHHFGEFMVSTKDASGAVSFSVETAQPHVWEGTLFYLAAMAASDPAAFGKLKAELPLDAERPRGCGCDTTDATVLLPLLSLWGLRLRRRRS